MKFGQVHHIEYYVNDLPTSHNFWSWFLPHLGYEKYQEFKGGISWRFTDGTYLVFVEVKESLRATVNDRNAAGLNHIAFCGKDADHLEELAGELSKRGITILKKDSYHLCFEDCDKIAVEVFLPD